MSNLLQFLNENRDPVSEITVIEGKELVFFLKNPTFLQLKLSYKFDGLTPLVLLPQIINSLEEIKLRFKVFKDVKFEVTSLEK